MWLRGKGLLSGRQDSKQVKHWTNLFHCARDFIQYATLWKNINPGLRQEATKTVLANKDNSCSSLYVYSLLCVFISQHSNKVDFITTDEAEIRGRGKKGRTVPDWGLRLPCLPLKLPLHYRSFLYGVRSRSEDVKGRSECGAS